MPFTQKDAEKAASKPADIVADTKSTNTGQSYDDGAAALSPRNSSSEEQQRQQAAKEQYRALLGKWLGDQLFGMVDKDLAPEKLLQYGREGLDNALNSIIDLIDPVEGFADMDEATGAEAVAKFAEALGGWAKNAAEKWLEGEDGQRFLAKANHWVEGHPGWVVAAALAAAAGAVASNINVPEIIAKFKLTDALDAKLVLDLGKIQSLAVSGASASLAYSNQGWTAQAGYTYKQGDQSSHNVSATIGHEGKEVTAGATLQGDMLLIDVGGQWTDDTQAVSAGISQIANDGMRDTLADVSLNLGDETYNVTYGSQYNFRTGQLAVDMSTLQLHTDDLATRTTVGSNGDDSYVGLGLDYTPADAFKLSLDYRLSAMQGQSVSVRGERAWESGTNQYSASGSGTYNFDSSRLDEAQLNFSWRDSEQFKGIALELKHKYDAVPETTFNAIADATAGEVMLRAQNRVGLSGSSVASNVAQAHAAYELNSDWTVFGGGKYGHQMDGFDTLHDNDKGAWVEAGVQFKSVPLKIGVRPSDGAVSFGITIPFGR